MDTKSKRRLLMVLLLVGALVMVPQWVMAGGTTACTDITNRATVDFQVGGEDQSPVESSPTGNSNPGVNNGTDTSFKVGNRVNVTIVRADGAEVTVYPGFVNAVLTFTVTNTGNLVQDYSFTALANTTGTANPFGGGLTDIFDATGVNVYVESDANGGYQALQDTATFIDELAVDGSKTVYIVVDTIPIAQSHDDLSVYTLTATTRDGGGGGEGNLTAEGAAQACGGAAAVVFGDSSGSEDADNDGKISDSNAYKVSAVVLKVQKESEVVWDPINLAVNPQAIPLAIVEYTITVTYEAGGAGSATGLAIRDVVPTNTVAQENLAAYGGTGEVELTTDDGSGPSTSNLDSSALTEWGTSAGSDIEVDCGITLDTAGEFCTIKFRVEIQ